MGGIVVDLLALAAIIAFAWAGGELGMFHAAERFAASLVGVVAGLAVGVPLGGLVHRALPMSVDVTHLVAAIAIGVVAYVLVRRGCDTWRQSRDIARDDDADAMEFQAGDAQLDGRRGGRAFGAALGALWVIGFAAMLVLLPADNVISRSTVQSLPGSALLAHNAPLRWLVSSFPHLTQTLPKGAAGAVVGPASHLPMHGDAEPRMARADVDPFLQVLNRVRTSQGDTALTFNKQLGGVAERTAVSLAADRTLSADRDTVRAQAVAALGDSTAADDVDVAAVWAHSPGNAMRAIHRSSHAAGVVERPDAVDVGIGAADAGWFNGTVYVVVTRREAQNNQSADAAQ